MQHSTVQPREILPFAAAALIGLASVLLPGPETDWLVFAIGAGLTVAIAAVGLTAAEKRRGRPLIVLLPLAYFVAVVILRHSGTTGATGFVPLVMLPIVWLAMFGTRRQLIIGLVAMTLALVVPFLVFGDPRYPVTSWRSALLFLVVAALTGLAIQSLVVRVRHDQRDARRRAPERHRDGDRGHRRERHDHRLQPRRRAHARLRRRRGRRQGVGGDAARSRRRSRRAPTSSASRPGPRCSSPWGPSRSGGRTCARTAGGSRCPCPSPPSATTTGRSRLPRRGDRRDRAPARGGRASRPSATSRPR